jgi:hypothetical protein
MKKELMLELAKRKNILNGLIFALNQSTGLDETSNMMLARAVTLANALAEMSVLQRFIDTPWVIKQNTTNPTYYQQVSVIGEIVTLSRQGKTSTVHYKTYMKEFRKANEAEVIQHLNYLNLSNRPYLQKIAIEDNSGSIAATSHNEQPIKTVKPADADFYCVTLKQGRGCTKYHQTYEDAEKEATRLSKQEDKKAYILGVVGEVEVVPTTTYETKINKY